MAAPGETETVPAAAAPLAGEESEDSEPCCRVCRMPGEQGHELRFPCRCRGSMRWVHEDCLALWLQRSHKQYCEICGYRFVYERQYTPGAPERLPLSDILSDVWVRVSRTTELLWSFATSFLVYFVLEPLFTTLITVFFLDVPREWLDFSHNPLVLGNYFATGFVLSVPSVLLTSLVPRDVVEAELPFDRDDLFPDVPNDADTAAAVAHVLALNDTLAAKLRRMRDSVMLNLVSLGLLVLEPYSLGRLLVRPPRSLVDYWRPVVAGYAAVAAPASLIALLVGSAVRMGPWLQRTWQSALPSLRAASALAVVALVLPLVLGVTAALGVFAVPLVSEPSLPEVLAFFDSKPALITAMAMMGGILLMYAYGVVTAAVLHALWMRRRRNFDFAADDALAFVLDADAASFAAAAVAASLWAVVFAVCVVVLPALLLKALAPGFFPLRARGADVADLMLANLLVPMVLANQTFSAAGALVWSAARRLRSLLGEGPGLARDLAVWAAAGAAVCVSATALLLASAAVGRAVFAAVGYRPLADVGAAAAGAHVVLGAARYALTRFSLSVLAERAAAGLAVGYLAQQLLGAAVLPLSQSVAFEAPVAAMACGTTVLLCERLAAPRGPRAAEAVRLWLAVRAACAVALAHVLGAAVPAVVRRATAAERERDVRACWALSSALFFGVELARLAAWQARRVHDAIRDQRYSVVRLRDFGDAPPLAPAAAAAASAHDHEE
eukprot:m51a1_g6214 hypothetical protein (726) ;mRNA; f:180740-183629